MVVGLLLFPFLGSVSWHLDLALSRVCVLAWRGAGRVGGGDPEKATALRDVIK